MAGNKVARVVDAVLQKEETDVKGNSNDTINDDSKEEELIQDMDDNQDVPADGWIEDKDEKIMDAKVMKKGDKKLIIVDMPNPKARWARPKK